MTTPPTTSSSTTPRGKFVIHTGPMKAAKTLHLIQAYMNAQAAKRKVQAFRPARDTRDDEGHIKTRFGGVTIPAAMVVTSKEIIHKTNPTTKLVLIDEGQFFDADLPDTVSHLLERGARIVLSGLDLDYRAQPFGPMPILLAMADEVIKHEAVCDCCGSDAARFTQRLTNGHPSKADEPDVIPEGSKRNVAYQARCHSCYQKPV